MSKKALRYLIYIWGSICLIAFIAVRFESIFNGLLKEDVVEDYWDKTRFGELYYFSMISHFREAGLPPAQRKFEHSEKHSSLSDCDILVFGDSFFEFSRHRQFPEKLSEDLSKNVHFVKNDFPLKYLAENGYKDTVPKLVLFERVERYIPVAFESPHVYNTVDITSGDTSSSLLGRIKNMVFYKNSEVLYDAMLKRSYLSSSFYSFIVTLKFDLYGEITEKTPLYLKDGSNSWLFYHDQVNESKTSFYYQHTKHEIDSICDNMASLSKQLYEKFNMQLLYLPLPAKYTLYHDLINNHPYNEFLPRLYRGLEERGVKFVNVYDNFLESDTLLYYRTDSHWNQKGIDIAYGETRDYMFKDSVLNHLINLE